MTSDQNMVNMVFDFNEQVVGVQDKPVNVLTEEQFEWTLKVYQEEIDEFCDARAVLQETNASFEDVVVGMVDACLDEVYYQLGTLKKMGLTREQVMACFVAIHSANMTKKRGATKRGSDEDAAKPTDFVDPKVALRQIIFGS